MFKNPLRRPSFLGSSKRTSLFGAAPHNASSPTAAATSPSTPVSPISSSPEPTTISSLASSSLVAAQQTTASSLESAQPVGIETNSPHHISSAAILPLRPSSPSASVSPASSVLSRSHTAPNPASRSSSSSSISSSLSAIERSFAEPAACRSGPTGRRVKEWDGDDEDDAAAPLFATSAMQEAIDGERCDENTGLQEHSGSLSSSTRRGPSLVQTRLTHPPTAIRLAQDKPNDGSHEELLDTLPSLMPTISPALHRVLSPTKQSTLPVSNLTSEVPIAQGTIDSRRPTPRSFFTSPTSAQPVSSPSPISSSLPSDEHMLDPRLHEARVHHHDHAHSPPHAAPPPIRAATLSATSDLANIPSVAIGTSGGSKDDKKKKIGFMGLVRNASRSAEAKAAAARALRERDDSLTPEQKVERAKHAERAHLLQTCMELGMEIYDIPPDGSCLYAAVSDQLYVLKIIKAEENHPGTTRLAAATYMRNNIDAFLPFLTCPPPSSEELGPNGEDPGETDGMMTPIGYERYCKRVESSGEWGGEPEILALSRFYKIPIHVIQSNHPKIVAHSPDPKAKSTLEPRQAKKIKAVRISYHRRLYGLGEHYNSLRKIQYNNMSGFGAMVPM